MEDNEGDRKASRFGRWESKPSGFEVVGDLTALTLTSEANLYKGGVAIFDKGRVQANILLSIALGSLRFLGGLTAVFGRLVRTVSLDIQPKGL